MTTGRHESIKDAYIRGEVKHGRLTLDFEEEEGTIQIHPSPANNTILVSCTQGEVDVDFQVTISDDDADSLAWDLAGDR